MPSTSTAVTSVNDEQKMEPTSSQMSHHRADDMDDFDMNNCKKSYGRSKTKIKDYNNTIKKDEPVKSVVPKGTVTSVLMCIPILR